MTVLRDGPVGAPHATGRGSFDIRRLDLTDAELMRRALAIHESAFPGVPGLERQLLHNARNAPKGTVFFGAFDGDRLIGLNGFVRHSVLVSGRRAAVYQSCSTATDPDYRGRGIFTSIVRHAQAVLANEALAIIGFPNENSTRIFVGQLGFRAVPLVRLLVPGPLIGAVCSDWAREQARENELVRFDHDELVAWKHASGANAISIHVYGDVSVWGHEYRNYRFGFPLRVFVVGGMCAGPIECSVPQRRGVGHLRRPFVYNFATAAGSTLSRVAGARAVRRDMPIFIDYALEKHAKVAEFEVSGGVADFF